MPSGCGALGGHDDGGGGSVGGLRGVAGGDGALGVEDGLEFGERFERGVGAGAFVLLEDGSRRAWPCPFPLGVVVRNGYGYYLVFELSGGYGGQGLLVGFVGELVLLLPGDAVVVGDALRGEAHGHVGAGVVVDEPGVDRDLVAAEGDVGHALGAAGEDDVGAAAADAVGGERDGLQAGGAVAVDGHGGGGDGQAGAEAGDAGDVHSLLGLGHGAAEDDVFDLGAVELRDAGEGSGDGDGGEVVGARGAEGSAWGFADGGADCGGDDDFFIGPRYSAGKYLSKPCFCAG